MEISFDAICWCYYWWGCLLCQVIPLLGVNVRTTRHVVFGPQRRLYLQDEWIDMRTGCANNRWRRVEISERNWCSSAVYYCALFAAPFCSAIFQDSFFWSCFAVLRFDIPGSVDHYLLFISFVLCSFASGTLAYVPTGSKLIRLRWFRFPRLKLFLKATLSFDAFWAEV